MHAFYSALVADGLPENAEHIELPMPPEAFGLSALGVFVALLLITWAFRGAGSRH